MFNEIKHTGSFSDASNGVTAVKQETAIEATIRRYLLLSFSLNKILSQSSMFTTRSSQKAGSSDSASQKIQRAHLRTLIKLKGCN